MQKYFTELTMLRNLSKNEPPRIKDTGKTTSSTVAKAGRGRKGGNPPNPNVSATNSTATGDKSGILKVKIFTMNLFYLNVYLFYKLTMNEYKNLNITTNLNEKLNSYGHTVSNSSLSFCFYFQIHLPGDFQLLKTNPLKSNFTFNPFLLQADNSKKGGKAANLEVNSATNTVTGAISDQNKVIPYRLIPSFRTNNYFSTNCIITYRTLYRTNIIGNRLNNYGHTASNSSLIPFRIFIGFCFIMLNAQSGSLTIEQILCTNKNNKWTFYYPFYSFFFIENSLKLYYLNLRVHLKNYIILQENFIPLDQQTFEDLDGNKRPISELDILVDSRNEAKRSRGDAPPRLSYATCAKNYVMLEFRASNPKVQLGQEDYGNIEGKLAFAFMKLPKPRPDTIPKIHQMGLSQGALWCAAYDDFTYQFCLENVPAFDTPAKYLPNPLLPPKQKVAKGSKPKKLTPEQLELKQQWEIPENELTYSYQVYGPNNKPFRYLKGRFPKDFWCEKHDDFIELLRAFHPQLDRYTTDPTTGQQVKYHMRISTGMENMDTEIIGGYFIITLEVEEDLLEIIARMNGSLTILSANIKLVGGNIDKVIQDISDKEAALDAQALEFSNDDFEDAEENEQPMNTDEPDVDSANPSKPTSSTSN